MPLVKTADDGFSQTANGAFAVIIDLADYSWYPSNSRYINS